MRTQFIILTLLVAISGVLSKGKKPKPKPYTWLVVTGGEKSDGSYLQSSEMVSYFGVCPKPDTIPDLLPEMSEAQSVSVFDQIVFCGGTQFGANATKNCWSLNPGNSDWAEFPPVPTKGLTSARALYSLTVLNGGPPQFLAVGGVGEDGNCLNTMEKYSYDYSFIGWVPLKATLPEPTCGQCEVTLGRRSVMIIGGGPARDTPTDYVWKIDLGKRKNQKVKPLQVLPVKLWRPACTRRGNSVYVSGGMLEGGSASADVYEYDIAGNTWTGPIGALNTARYGHVMGRTTEEQMVVAGGADNAGSLSSIEDSYDNGNVWTPRSQTLGEARKYPAMAQVPAFKFNCD